MALIPARPDEESNTLAGKDVRCRITKGRKVFIGGVELPGWIAERGLKIEAADKHNLNQLIVRFYVGEIDIDDDVADTVPVQAMASCYTVDDARYLEGYRRSVPGEPSRSVPIHQIPVDSDA
jgi:hypothetical protein